MQQLTMEQDMVVTTCRPEALPLTILRSTTSGIQPPIDCKPYVRLLKPRPSGTDAVFDLYVDFAKLEERICAYYLEQQNAKAIPY